MTEHVLIFAALILLSGIVLIPLEKRINSKSRRENIMTPTEFFEDYDWCSAWEAINEENISDATRVKYANIETEKEDIIDIPFYIEGENDGDSWIAILAFKEGLPMYGILEGGCDYTGWDCQGSSSLTYCLDLQDLTKMLTIEQEARLDFYFIKEERKLDIAVRLLSKSSMIRKEAENEFLKNS